MRTEKTLALPVGDENDDIWQEREKSAVGIKVKVLALPTVNLFCKTFGLPLMAFHLIYGEERVCRQSFSTMSPYVQRLKILLERMIDV